MTSTAHPFDPLHPREITKAAEIVRWSLPGEKLNFRVITLKEPPKKEMVAFLNDFHSKVTIQNRPTRNALVQVLFIDEHDKRQFVELIVDLDHKSIAKTTYLEGRHPYIDSAYMQDVEKACLADDRVQAEIKKLELPPEAHVVVEVWAYATDGVNDMSDRITMCWFFMRLLDDLDANYYAYPLNICAEVSENLEVTKVYCLPSSVNEQIYYETKAFDRTRIHDTNQSEYHPDLRPAPRSTTRPLQIVQPEGPSFQIEANHIRWEKWTMRIGFNYREGLVLHDIRYDDRSLFYRISLAEMFVPYGDPRAPFPRKGAFDIGNDGAGINANNLRLGCDCLGVVKYFDAWHNTSSGEPLKLPNVVCCHEQDDGILWKHTNFRTGNAVVTRSRILVLQTIITVSNYEYIFAFHFGQDASIHYEVRATGIMSTCQIKVEETAPFGTVVAPGVLAPYHQHLFCLRIDPAIDGHKNSLQIEESVRMPLEDSVMPNPFGVGYTTTSQIVEEERGLDLDHSKARTFKIINESVRNPITGTPVGFKLIPAYSQMLLADPSSYHWKRSEFAEYPVWVTRYDDDEYFPSGRYTMQSMGKEGIASAISKRRNDSTVNTSVRDNDIVVWHTFGSTHNPRAEDWPVMPSEKMTVGLKPVNFFTGNPSLDVAVSAQEKSKSVQVKDSSCC